jgi:hypothetical protein
MNLIARVAVLLGLVATVGFAAPGRESWWTVDATSP